MLTQFLVQLFNESSASVALTKLFGQRFHNNISILPFVFSRIFQLQIDCPNNEEIAQIKFVIFVTLPILQQFPDGIVDRKRHFYAHLGVRVTLRILRASTAIFFNKFIHKLQKQKKKF